MSITNIVDILHVVTIGYYDDDVLINCVAYCGGNMDYFITGSLIFSTVYNPEHVL